MATVRIYKVAELLNTSSQEVMELLRRDHGIEVKSASSTIEEVVARQFVDRLARQRNITLPPPRLVKVIRPPQPVVLAEDDIGISAGDHDSATLHPDVDSTIEVPFHHE